MTTDLSMNEAPEGITVPEFRNALARAVTAVTVVTTDGPGGLAGVTCSAVASVCDTPPTVLVCMNRRSYVNGVIKANDVLCVNWLSAHQVGGAPWPRGRPTARKPPSRSTAA
jgi:flavin reductase (NADH)/flavin reductase/chlorophenol-4-monooxygenase component 1